MLAFKTRKQWECGSTCSGRKRRRETTSPLNGNSGCSAAALRFLCRVCLAAREGGCALSEGLVSERLGVFTQPPRRAGFAVMMSSWAEWFKPVSSLQICRESLPPVTFSALVIRFCSLPFQLVRCLHIQMRLIFECCLCILLL